MDFEKIVKQINPNNEDECIIEYNTDINGCGYKSWFLNGKLHREDGPAIIWSDGLHEWWLNGSEYTKKDYDTYMLRMRLERLKYL